MIKNRLSLLLICSLILIFINKPVFSEIVKQIEINGNERVSDETIIMFSKISINDDLKSQDLNNIIKNIFKSNFFNDVFVSFKNNKLIITVDELPIIENINFDGIKSKTLLEKITDNLQLISRSSYNETILNQYNKSEIKLSDFGNAPINGDTIIYQWSELAAYQGYDKNYFETNYRNIKVRNEDAKDLSHGYLASISFIDELVGRLVNTLKEYDLEKNTIIIFMGDHGFHLGDQQIWGKHSSYEKSTHTPLIIVDPSKATGGTCMNFVELLDIYPTLIDLNGIDKNPNLDGKSLAIFVEDPNLRSPRLAFSQYQTFQKQRSFSNYMAYAVYTKDFNYIEWQDLDNNRNVVQKELYQMDRVRAEITNLSNQPRYSMLQHALSSKIKKNFNF